MSHRSLKTAAGLVAALALAYTGASWYAGRLAQDRVEAWVEQANQEIAAQWASADPRPVLTIQAYRRGVFSSDIRYGFQFRDEDGRDQTLGLHDALAHGPWPWAAVRQGEWRPAAAWSLIEPLPGGLWQPWFDAQPAGAAPWTLRSRIGFDGRVAAQWRLEPARLAGNRLDFSGGLVRIDYDPETREAAVSGRVDRLDAVDADSGVRVRFEGLDFDGRTTRSGESDLQSRQQARFGQIHVDVPDAPPVAFIGPSLSLDTVRTGGLLDSRLAYDLGQLQVDRQDLGRITLALTAEHLDVAGLQALADELGQLNRREDPDEALSEQDRQRLRALAVPVLAAGPRLTLDALRWETPQGTSELKALAEFRPAAEDAPQDLGGLIESAIRQLSAHLSLSKPMLLQVVRQTQHGEGADTAVALTSMLFDQYAGRLERQGLAQRQGDAVAADYRYADGQVAVNGRTMSPAEFAAQFGDLAGLGQ
ncbi:GTP-binding protein YdgA OS=Castellaniella defragrans (strain DSM / CCUG 39792 / 65Phen) OX=1437824 GN=BN940_05841 PE=4 SV=1 [Castellaniella denitrificans]